MIRKLILAAVALMFVGVAIPKASADMFALNIDYCSCGGTGSVTLTLGTGTGAGGNGIATGDVQFDVILNSPLHFHQTTGLDAFNFNYSGSSALTVASITSGYNTTLLTGQHEGGAGTFSDSVQYGTNPGVAGTELIFELSGTSLSLAQFEVLSGGPPGNTKVDFAANVSNGTCTGLIGGGNGTTQSTARTLNSGSTTCASPVPEKVPTFALLLGTSLLFAGKLLKAKLLVG